MDGISRSRGWDKEIPHCVLPMEQLVLSDKWARKHFSAHDCIPSKTKVELLSVRKNSMLNFQRFKSAFNLV